MTNIDLNKTLDIKSSKVLENLFGANYTLGVHGFDSRFIYKKNEVGDWELNQEQIAILKASILADGLNYQDGRTLTSTVSFDLTSYIDTNGTYASGIIIALPKILKSPNKEDIELGTPHEVEIEYDPINNRYTKHDRNHSTTSLADAYLPSNNNLNPMFILGTYDKVEEGIKFKLNPNHILFTNGLVPNDFYDECLSRINNVPTK